MGPTRRSLFAVAVAWCVASPVTAAGEATPTVIAPLTTPLRLTIDDLPPDGVVRVGMARTTFEPGANLEIRAGSGATVLWVEAGEIALTVPAGSPAPTIQRAEEGATPAAEGSTSVSIMAARGGDAVVVPSGAKAIVRNEGTEPAATLTLLSAPDAESEPDGGVAATVLVGAERTFPSSSVNLALDSRTLEPGERLVTLPAPTVTVVAAVERAQNVKLGTSATGFLNRDSVPMPIYVLTLESSGSAT